MNINLTLSESSINQAIKEVKKYKKWVETKNKLLIRKLALIGAQEASVRFATAIYDGINDVAIEVGQTSNGWMITAKGTAVAFIEFGAGVYHNTNEPYPLPRPEGIVGIGEYGKGHGKNKAWGFYDESGSLIITRGTPAQMPMWYATEEMKNQIERIAREVFSNE